MSLRSLSNRFFKFYLGIPIRISNKINKKLNTELTAAFCDEMEKVNKEFVSVLYRPQNADMLNVLDSGLNVCHEKVGIVIQGPILKKNDFTYQSVLTYRKMFSNIEIILSTWDDSDSDYLLRFNSLGCHILLNKKPIQSGKGNVNFQLISSLEGVKKAKELGCSYVMKTRTDQRIYNYNACNFLIDLINFFPAENTAQHGRIVVSQGGGGNIFIPYYTADFFYFGKTEDVILLFDIELDTQDYASRKENDENDKLIAQKNDVGTTFHLQAPQNKIMETYAKNIGYNPVCTVENYWGFIKQSLIGISTEELGLYWKKYSRNMVENTWTHHYEPTDSDDQLLTYNLTFTNWLSIYSGHFKYSDALEKYRLRSPNL